MFKTFQSTATKSNRQPKFSPGPQTGRAQVDGQPNSAPPAVGGGAKQFISPIPHSALRTPHSPLAPRPSPLAPHRAAVTLVELLIVIAILAILASMVLFALAGAEGTAKEMRTRSTINKLHNLIMQKYESYRTRRAPITIPSSVGAVRPVAFAQHRLNAIRELMRMEMPDRYTDIIDNPVTPTAFSIATPKISRPSSSQSYYRALPANLKSNFATNFATYSQYQGAECLYLVITRGIDDPDVMEQFSPSEIGDADDDGMKEFHDAWGQPISFLRWAPGHVSQMQPKNSVIPYYTEHDPFDPRGIHRPPNSNQTGDAAWCIEFSVPDPQKGVHPPLFPLIFSAGSDGEQGIYSDTETPLYYSQTTSTLSPPNNPYFPFPNSNGDKALIGSPLEVSAGVPKTEHEDNITNHDLGTGPGQ